MVERASMSRTTASSGAGFIPPRTLDWRLPTRTRLCSPVRAGGRQYKATQKRDRGVPKKAGYVLHLGYVLRGVREVHSTDAGCRATSRRRVDGSSIPCRRATARPSCSSTDQVLPCYLVDQRNHTRAHAALERAVKVVGKTGARPSASKNRSGRRAMPAPGAYAAGAGTPVAPAARRRRRAA